MQFRRYELHKHSLTVWTFSVTLTLNAVIQFLHRTLQLIMLYYQTKFGCKQTRSLGDRAEIVIFWLNKPVLWPWVVNQFFCMTLWLTMLYYHTKFSIKMISGSENIILINIHKQLTNILNLCCHLDLERSNPSGQTFTDILNLCCDLDLEHSNPIFPQDTPAYDGVLSN